MIENVFVLLTLYFITLLFLIYFHEAGHYTALKMIGLKVKSVNFDKYRIVPDSVSATGHVEGSNPRIKMSFALINGLLFSLIPVCIFYVIIKDVFLTVCLIYFAVNGAKKDLGVVRQIYLTRSFKDVECTDYGVVGHDY